MAYIRQAGSLAFVFGLFTTIFAGIPWYVVVSDDPVIPWWFRTAIFMLLGGIFVVLVSLAIDQKKQRKHHEAPGDIKPGREIIMVNSLSVPGREITQVLGMVQGHTVYAIWLGKDLSAIVRLILGGELTEYTEMMGNARLSATTRMKSQALEMGADAVINVRYMTTSVVGSAAELLVYGTAVKFS